MKPAFGTSVEPSHQCASYANTVRVKKVAPLLQYFHSWSTCI